MEKTIEEVGCQSFDTSEYKLYIGPPLIDTFMNHCNMGREDALNAVEVYRRYYDTEGKFKNIAYEGIAEVLSEIRKTGAKIVVATSKYEKFASEIVDILGLTPYIDAVCGSTLDGKRKDKKDIIVYAVDRLGGDFSHKIAMVGDTYFDARGARLCGVDFVGVTYGYGDRESMEKEGATVFAENVSELKKYLV